MAYAITFDLDTELLSELYDGDSFENAYRDIRNHLENNGFEHMQGSVYFGNSRIDAVNCITVIQSFALEHEWFVPSCKDIRMLRIEENNNVMPALEILSRKKKKK